MKNRSTNLSAMRENHFSGKKWDDLEESVWIENMELLFQEFSRVLKKGGSLVVFMAIIKLESIIKIAEKIKFYYKTTGIWHKKNPMPRNKDLHFINSTESWLYFTNITKTGIFNNKNQLIGILWGGPTMQLSSNPDELIADPNLSFVVKSQYLNDLLNYNEVEIKTNQSTKKYETYEIAEMNINRIRLIECYKLIE